MRGTIDPPPGFGGDSEPEWRPSAEHDDPVTILSTHAAHRVLSAVRSAWPRVYPAEKFTGRALAGKLGGSERPAQKRLAGEQPLTLADVMALAALLGEDILDALPRRDTDLFPVAYGSLLTHWSPGSGRLPTFVNRGSDTIDWDAVTNALAAYDIAEDEVCRQHLLTADTYRYQLVAALEANGIAAKHLEYVDVSIEHSCGMTLWTSPRKTIVIADLRGHRSRRDAAATLMRIMYQTVVYGAHERILLMMASEATASQIEIYLPAALDTAEEPFVLQFQQAVDAGLDGGPADQLLPDIEVTALGHAQGAAHQLIIALRVGK